MRYYVLQSPDESEGSFATSVFDGRDAEYIQCDVYGNVEIRRHGPVEITSIPTRKHDFVWTWYSDLLATDRARNALLADGISGCSFVEASLPASVRARGTQDRLWEVCVIGFAGFADPSGGVYIRDRCDECGLYSYTFRSSFSTLLNSAKWDGSDIFTFWPFPRVKICTDRMADLIRRSGLSGVALFPIEEFEVPNGDAAPGMPEDILSEVAVARLRSDPDYLRITQHP